MTKTNETPKVKRNILLTVLLILIILANSFVGFIFFLNVIGIAEGAYATMTQAMVIFSMIVCLGNVICAIGIWSWRKWGVIGYGVLVLSGYITTGLVSGDFSNFYGLVGLIMIIILIIPYWKFMKWGDFNPPNRSK
jgi:hypothetical protein